MMTRRYLPAAALRPGALINTKEGETLVTNIRFGYPAAGRLVVVDASGAEWPYGGAEPVEILALPRMVET